MEALKLALSGLIGTVRERLQTDGNAEWLSLARWVRELSVGLEQLNPSTQEALLQALQGASPFSDGALDALLEAFGAHQKVIGRAAALADRWRYPTPRDLLLANERMSLAPAQYDGEQLERALLLGTLTAPDADASQRAGALYDALNTLQPFAEYNRSVALLAALAFLQANGFRFDLDPAQAAERLAHPEWQPLPVQPADRPDERTFADILESLIDRYRDALGAAEQKLRQAGLVKRDSLPVPVPTEPPLVPGPAFHWRYLTVQDLIWINTEVTGAPQPYNYDGLEEATYYQYSYRQSMDVPLQAARFLWGYLTYRPFAKGNLSTALIAVLTFLEINGHEVHLPAEQAAEWFQAVAQRRKHPLSAIRQIVTLSRGVNTAPVREVAHHLIERYEEAVHSLLDSERPTSAAAQQTGEQP
jgi:prophage maintenance system killer protein